MIRLFLLTAIAVTTTSYLGAATIYSVTGPLIAAGGIDSQQTIGVSWTQTGGYSDVVISATLEGVPSDLLTAYLTTKIGPGTTVANEIAHASVAFPGPSLVDLPLLNVPLLEPGTYFLTLSSSARLGGSLAETTTPSQMFGPGVVRNGDYYTSNPAAYPPGSSVFLPPPIGGLFVFSVAGTPIPEPAYGKLVGTTVIALFLCRFRRSLRARQPA